MSVITQSPPLGIGSPIVSGTPNSVLYLDGSGDIAQNNPGFTYDGTALTIRATSPTFLNFVNPNLPSSDPLLTKYSANNGLTNAYFGYNAVFPQGFVWQNSANTTKMRFDEVNSILTVDTLHLTNPLGVVYGGTGTATAFTAGSVVFAGASGVYSQDNSSFFWDNTNKRLGIGGTPSYPLHVQSSANGFAAVIANNAVSGDRSGLLVYGGSSASDYALIVQNAPRTTNWLLIGGDGKTTFAGVTEFTGTVAFDNPVTIGTANPSVPALLLTSVAGQIVGNFYMQDASHNNTFYVFPSGAVGIVLTSATDNGIVVRGAVGQSVNLQEWQNYLGTPLTQITKDGNLIVGTATPPAGPVFPFYSSGSDATGNGVQVVVENTSSAAAAFAIYTMRKNGSNVGLFFGGDQTGFGIYGIANGITMRPGQATQDLGLAAGNGVSGTALGPALIIKPDTKIAIGDTSGWIASNPGVAQVTINPVSASIPGLQVTSTSPSNPYSGFTLLSGASNAYTAITVGRTAPEFYMGISAGAGQYLGSTVAGDSAIIHIGKLLFGSAIGASPHVVIDTSGNTSFGNQTAGATPTPLYLSLGGTFSSTAGVNPKIKLYDDGVTLVFGIGVSSGQLDYMVGTGAAHAWYSSSTRIMYLDGSANLSLGANTASLTASPLTVSFGGTYGSNTPGSFGNLKWLMYYNTGDGNKYGIGMSAGLMEFQAGVVGSHQFFVDAGTSAMIIGGGFSAIKGYVGIGNSSPAAQLHVTAVASTNKGFIIQGASSQSDNLQELQNSSTTVLTAFDKDGKFGTFAGFADGINIAVGTSTGTKIGTATSQKLGFWNTTPIVQPTTAVTAATFVANTSGIANDTATWDGYTVGQVVKALRNEGLLA